MTQILLTPRIPSTDWETRASEIENEHHLGIHTARSLPMPEFIRYLENEDRVGRKERLKAGHGPGHALRVRRSPAEFTLSSTF
jgi:hypothetical protein